MNTSASLNVLGLYLSARHDRSGKKDKSEIQCYKCQEMGHYAPECKKSKIEKALITKGRDWADTSDSDEEVNYALMASIEPEDSELKVPSSTLAYNIDDISELRIYLKALHVSYRDRSINVQLLHRKRGLGFYHQYDFYMKPN
ncbi:zinc finger CCHC domain-containing protein [Klebsiella pneumoniae]